MGFNLKDVKGQSFDPIPEGRYTVVVDKAEITTTKESGNPMIKATLKIVEGDFKNRLAWDNFVLTEKSLWKLKTFLEAADSKLSESGDATEQDIANAMVGAKVSVYLENRVGPEGQVSSNAKNYTAIEGQPATAKKTATGKTSLLG
jgi:hypothetical protein